MVRINLYHVELCLRIDVALNNYVEMYILMCKINNINRKLDNGLKELMVDLVME